MPSPYSKLLAAVVLATWVAQAWAIDPITLFLLNTLRNRIATAIAEHVIEEAMKPPEVERYFSSGSRLTPQDIAEVERRKLRRLIDDNFGYLSDAERDQVFAGVSKVLSDPAYESQKAEILQDFTQTARAIGETYRLLQSLSSDEKREIVAQARAQFRRMPQQEQEELADHLRARRLPLPRDLSDMLLAEVVLHKPPSAQIAADPSRPSNRGPSVTE